MENIRNIRLALRVALIIAGREFPVEPKENAIFITCDKYCMFRILGEIPEEAGRWELKKCDNEGEYALTFEEDAEYSIHFISPEKTID